MSQKFAIHRSHLPKHKLLSSYPIMSDSKGNAVESGSVRHGQQAFEALPNNTHRNWWQDEGLRWLTFFQLTGYAGTINSGYDSSLMNGLLTIPFFNAAIDHASGTRLGLITAGYPLGSLLAFQLAAWVSDRFGRKRAIMYGAVITIIATLCQGLTKGPWALFGTRIILGIGTAFEIVAAPTIVAEITHPRTRAQSSALTQTCYYLGSIVAAWVTFGTLTLNSDWSWRIPILLQVVPPLFQLSLLWWCPESPRWLLRVGRRAEALDTLAKYHANGVTEDPLVQFELNEIEAAIALETSMTSQSSYKAFIQTKGNRHRMWILVSLGFVSQWVGMGVISYYFAAILRSIGIIDPTQQAGLNGGLQVWNWCLAISGALAVERLGRRLLWLISTGGLLCTFIVVTACSAVYANTESKAAGYVVVAFLFLFSGFFGIAYTPMGYSYPIEILPFGLRAKGHALSQTCVFIALFFNQFVNPIALDSIGWKYYIVFIVICALQFVNIYFTFPEVKGRTLEEIAEVFDGVSIVPPETEIAIDDVWVNEDKLAAEKM
ncbi:hypothetical protein AYX14_04548 [Cryptococcus neoformans]|nr:hypothetical protein AYX14_04548 [Cryptococcus neoformans var. grubii]